jgi:hypothetical protein
MLKRHNLYEPTRAISYLHVSKDKFNVVPASFADAFGFEATRDANESLRRQFRLNRSHRYKDPFLVTKNNFQHSSQSINIAADPTIIVGIARLPHFV